MSQLGELTRQFGIRKQMDQDIPQSCLLKVAKPALQMPMFFFSKCSIVAKGIKENDSWWIKGTFLTNKKV